MGTAYLLHKPKGVLSSKAPEHGMKTAYEVLEESAGKVGRLLGMVGRLDCETTGALLFTDSAELTRRVRDDHQVEKTYVLTLAGQAGRDFELSRLEEPVHYTNAKFGEGVWTAPASSVRVLRIYQAPTTLLPFGGMLSDVEVTINEGRHRQIRRLCHQAGLKLRHLHRSRIGNLSVDGLKEGEARRLDTPDIALLLGDKG